MSTRTSAKEDGHVKVLMSCLYNNFEAKRPLPPDATDEEYDAEFGKAIKSVERAMAKFKKDTDMQNTFAELCCEYEFLLQMEEIIQGRDHLKIPLTCAEKAILERVRLMQLVVGGHIDIDDWDVMLNDDLADMLEQDDE